MRPKNCCRGRRHRYRDQRSSQVQGTPMAGAAIQARKYEQHRVGERLWNGISTVRVNCGTAIVGTPEQASKELARYWQLGIDEFILSGYPHVEESRRVARQVMADPGVRPDLVASEGPGSFGRER